MLNRLLSLIIFSLIFSTQIYSQELDPEDLKNLSSDEINSLISELNQEEITDQEKTDLPEPTLQKLEIAESNIFGHNFLKTLPTSISATTDLPVPNEYKVSLNDEINVILTGSKKEKYNLKVKLDGSIFFPELGSVLVVGNTYDQLRKKLEDLVEKSYVGVNIDISFSELSAKKISIIGAVSSPGTYIVNPYTTISNALAYAGGIEEYASLRNIKLIKPNNDKVSFDLYDLIVKGNRSKDVTVSAGDTIVVDGTSRFIDIAGSVIRPMTYEYRKDDSFEDLIQFALGLKRNGNDQNITATINENGRRVTKKINKDIVIGNQDVEALYVGNNVSIDSQGIFVSGDSVTSGFYETSGGKLGKFLEKIKFSSDIYPFYAVYESYSGSGLVKNTSSFSLSDPNSYSDMSASKNTKLSFFSREDILDIESFLINLDTGSSLINQNDLVSINQNDLVSISIADQNIKIPLKGKISPKQLYLFFGSSGEINEEKVSVITFKDSFTDAYESFFDSKDLVAISFPSIKSDNLIEVEIQGEVLNPGKYSIASSSTIFDLYVLSGGLRENAFESGIALFREEVKEKQLKAIREAKSVLTDAMIQKSNSISDRGMVDIESVLKLADLFEPTGRVAGKFSEESYTSRNFVLKDGDLITVPSLSYEVVVQGEVLNSSSFVFEESMSYKDYIEAAGGFSDYADRRSVFIIKANGLSTVAGNNIFSGQVMIEPGDTIVIPRNLDQLEPLPLISMATKIIADIAFSAASLNAIQD